MTAPRAPWLGSYIEVYRRLARASATHEIQMDRLAMHWTMAVLSPETWPASDPAAWPPDETLARDALRVEGVAGGAIAANVAQAQPAPPRWFAAACVTLGLPRPPAEGDAFAVFATLALPGARVAPYLLRCLAAAQVAGPGPGSVWFGELAATACLRNVLGPLLGTDAEAVDQGRALFREWVGARPRR
jgi:hypothetical protein